MEQGPSKTTLAALRQEYRRAGLRRADLDPKPVVQFGRWFQQACDAELLKAFDERGFVFFTNDASRKAPDIAQQPAVSLLFPWYGLQRQLAVLGPSRRISLVESLAYFDSCPFGSEIGAWVSRLCQVNTSRSLLEQQWQSLRRRFRYRRTADGSWQIERLAP